MSYTPNANFKKVRKSLNLSQVKLAEKLKVSQGTITDIERGRIGISKSIIKKFKENFDIDYTEYQDSISSKNNENNNEKIQDSNTGGVSGGGHPVPGHFADFETYNRISHRLYSDLAKEDKDLSDFLNSTREIDEFQWFMSLLHDEYLVKAWGLNVPVTFENASKINYQEVKEDFINRVKELKKIQPIIQKLNEMRAEIYKDFTPLDTKGIIEKAKNPWG